ncbi:hypothetical protein [Alkaliphilus transvaalensis]|uniref:hypothetical protein n=1 Tax=Alkaliphilus transvaalensis TaxID=114628 RepID=UPI000479C847|nr:hypothetical protein [Alkaliphilus transvaalensis]
MNIEHRKLIDEYKNAIKDFMDYTETEDLMGIILRGHLFIENELMTLISNVLVNPSKIKLPYFSNKLDAAFSLGIIEEQWYGAFKKLNKVRNNYAHDLRYEFSENDYEDLVSTLSKDAKEEFIKDLEAEEIVNSIVQVLKGKDKNTISLKDKTRILLSNFMTYLKLQNLQIDSVLKEIYLQKQLHLLNKE